MSIMNELLAGIVVATGGTVTNPSNRNQLLKDWLSATEITTRAWTIGNNGDDYGYAEQAAVGSLIPNIWFSGDTIIEDFLVDNSSNAVVFRSADSTQWNGLDDVTLSVDGSPDITLSWNGSFYVSIDPTFTAYIVTRLGNTLQVEIQ